MLAEHLETLLTKSKVFELGQPYYTGMPHRPVGLPIRPIAVA